MSNSLNMQASLLSLCQSSLQKKTHFRQSTKIIETDLFNKYKASVGMHEYNDHLKLLVTRWPQAAKTLTGTFIIVQTLNRKIKAGLAHYDQINIWNIYTDITGKTKLSNINISITSLHRFHHEFLWVWECWEIQL